MEILTELLQDTTATVNGLIIAILISTLASVSSFALLCIYGIKKLINGNKR